MTFEITGLNDDTLGAAAQVWFEGWHDAHAAIVPEALTQLRTLEDFERRLKGHMVQTRVAVLEGEVLGFVIVVKGELYQMYVAKPAQGTGVAKGLMQEALTRICANGEKTAWLSCSVGNARAAAFYEKTGWINVGEEPVSVDTSKGPFDLTVWRFEQPL